MIVYLVYPVTFIIPINAVLLALLVTSQIRIQIDVTNVLNFVWFVRQMVVNNAKQDIIKKI